MSLDRSRARVGAGAWRRGDVAGSDPRTEELHDGSAAIGPPATHLLLANDDVRIWLMDVPADGKQWRHRHDHDYVLFYLTDVLATVHDAPEDHAAVWSERYGNTDTGAASAPQGVMTYAGSLFYIPGTGFLSPGFHVIGTTPMLAPLIEVIRPAGRGHQDVGYARTDALVGCVDRPGCVHLLENDRVRIYQTILGPGQSDELRHRLDAAVFVIEGSALRIAEEDGGRRRTVEEHRGDREPRWCPGTGRSRHQLQNVGSSRYRELSVELK